MEAISICEELAIVYWHPTYNRKSIKQAKKNIAEMASQLPAGLSIASITATSISPDK